MKSNTGDIRIQTLIGKGTVVSGDFYAEGSVRIDGAVDGNVKVSEHLVEGATGRINGNVEALTAVVGGEIKGNVTAPDKLEITQTARVIGDLSTNSIIIDEQAVFQGNVNMNQDVTAASERKRIPAREVKQELKLANAAVTQALTTAGMDPATAAVRPDAAQS